MAVKVHLNRCIIKWPDFHVSKSNKQRAKNFELSFNNAFDEVVNMCIAQHGENWLYPQLVAAFREMNKNPQNYKTQIHSVEIWNEGKLAGGELGYVCGKYCFLCHQKLLFILVWFFFVPKS
jgi:Leu/Phe-tRNA-protein transferase